MGDRVSGEIAFSGGALIALSEAAKNWFRYDDGNTLKGGGGGGEVIRWGERVPLAGIIGDVRDWLVRDW